MAHLVTHIAFTAVPGARAIEESVAQRDKLDPWSLRRRRFQFCVRARTRRYPRSRVKSELLRLIGETRAGRIPESRRLQNVPAHTGLADRTQQVCIPLSANFVIARGGSFHLRARVVR